MITIKRQFIRDVTGAAIGVILPIEEFARVKDILEQGVDSQAADATDDRLRLMEQAASDPQFIADMNEVMSDFTNIDQEWWEPAE